ncbi:MAG: peptidylprolyl isomerase [Planctomycetes bacterium]|nr:peptidylprolyl isomerase [Planctomycetota bacterium]
MGRALLLLAAAVVASLALAAGCAGERERARLDFPLLAPREASPGDIQRPEPAAGLRLLPAGELRSVGTNGAIPIRAANPLAVIIQVDDTGITARDLLDALSAERPVVDEAGIVLSRDESPVEKARRKTARDRVIALEREALGLVVPGDLLERSVAADLATVREQFSRESHARGMTLEEYLASASPMTRLFGPLTMAQVEALIRRRLAEIDLPKVMLADLMLLTDEWVRVHRILTPSRAKAEELRAALLEGASFTAVARRESTDPGAARHAGLMGYLFRNDEPPRAAKAVFELPVGAVSEPIGAETGGYGLFTVIEKGPRRVGGWKELGPEVLKSFDAQRYRDNEELRLAAQYWLRSRSRKYETRDLTPPADPAPAPADTAFDPNAPLFTVGGWPVAIGDLLLEIAGGEHQGEALAAEQMLIARRLVEVECRGIGFTVPDEVVDRCWAAVRA